MRSDFDVDQICHDFACVTVGRRPKNLASVRRDNVRFASQADVGLAPANVLFTPKSGHCRAPLNVRFVPKPEMSRRVEVIGHS